MKTKLIIVALLGSIFINLQSCAFLNDGTKGPTVDNRDACSEPYSTLKDDEILESGSNLNYASETQAMFIELIQANPIDQDYKDEVTGETTLDFRKRENKYTDIWLNELAFSSKCFMAILSEEEKEEYQRLQNEWKANLDNEILFIRNLFASDPQSAKQGSLFWFELDYYYREQIRERVLYIKYLLFLKGNNICFLYEQY